MYIIKQGVLKIVSLFILLSFTTKVYSQSLNNSSYWIDYSKSYLKCSINESGIYRISANELLIAGLTSLKNISILRLGKEVSILTSKENAGLLDFEGYIEFYGEKNSGELDSLVYRPQSARLNPYQSLFSDVASYFIYNSDVIPQRINITKVNNNVPTDYFLEQIIIAPNTQYSFNNSIGLLPILQQSFFEPGEGWTGNFISADTLGVFKFELEGLINLPNETPSLNYRLNGRSRVPHSLDYYINGKLNQDKIKIDPFGVFDRSETLPFNSSITLGFRSNAKQEYDWYSSTFFKFSYPRLLNDIKVLNRKIVLGRNLNQPLLISNFSGDITAYDITNVYKPIKLEISNKLNSNLIASEKTNIIYLADKYLKPNQTELVKFTKYASDVEFLVVSNKQLLNSAEKYASYRSSNAGGAFKTSVAYIDDIYNQFFYGDKSPMAIRYFLEQTLNHNKRKNLLLLGRAVTFPDVLKTATEFVPSIGYPGSDALFSTGLFGFESDVQAVPTARLNVVNDTEAINYLNKVKEFEAIKEPQEWQKNILHLSGGQNIFELLVLKNLLNNIESKATKSFLGGKVLSKNKKTDAEVEEAFISKEINEGLGMVTFAGHGASNFLDFNIGNASNPILNYSNKGKYPIMFFNGCGVGNVFFRYNPLSTDWLITPDKGAIAVFANSFWSYLQPTEKFTEVLYNKLFVDSEVSKMSLGEIHQAINIELAKQKADPYNLANMHQVVLQGDPALRVFPISKPDYDVSNSSLWIQSKNTFDAMRISDSIRVGFFAKNLGRYESSGTLDIKITLKGRNGESKIINSKVNSFANRDTLTILFKKEFELQNIELKLDPNNIISELNENNNVAILSFENSMDWEEALKYSLFPENILPDNISPILSVLFDGKNIENNAAVSKNVKIAANLKDDRSLKSSNSELLKVFIKKCSSCNFEILQSIDLEINAISSNELQLVIKDQDLKPGNYSILIQSKDEAGNSVGTVYSKDFRVLEQFQESVVSLYPNPSVSFTQLEVKVFSNVNPLSIDFEVFDNQGRQLFYDTIEATVGKNSKYLPVRDLYGAGVYIIKTNIVHNDGKKEVISQKLIVN